MTTTFHKTTNNAVGTLSASIDDNDLSFALETGEGTLYPISGPFWVTAEDEILECSSRTGDTFTVSERGAQGTVATSHASGVEVNLYYTAEQISEIQDAVNSAESNITTNTSDIANRVVGPGSSTDNALVRFDSTTGKIVQNSGAILDDSNNLSGLGHIRKVDKWKYWCPGELMTGKTVGGQTTTVRDITTETTFSFIWCKGYTFPTGVQSYVGLMPCLLPSSYNGEQLTVSFYWIPTVVGSPSGDVKWWLQYQIVNGDGQDLISTTSESAVQAGLDAYQGDNKLHITSVNFTPSTAAANTWLNMSVRRRGTGTSSDTGNFGATLLAVRITYA